MIIGNRSIPEMMYIFFPIKLMTGKTDVSTVPRNNSIIPCQTTALFHRSYANMNPPSKNVTSDTFTMTQS